jgi:SSS family solute:Na+ symporter
MQFSLGTIDVLIVCASLLAVVLVGLGASRGASRSAKSYFLAGGRMPWYVIGAAFVSTSVSSEQIVGTVGAAYKHGMGIANWEWFSLPVVSLFVTFFVPLYLRSGITTIPDLLSRRFGPLCGSIYSWVMLFVYILIFQATILYSGSLAFSELTGWNFYVVLWAIVILVGSYSIKGGLASVMWTDAVQCLMLFGGGLTLFFIALAKIPGGWGAMMRASPERFHLYHPPSDPIAPFLGLLCGAVGLFIFYQAGNQVMVQRVLSARTRWDGMMGIVFSGFINLVRPLVTCFLGFIVYHWIHIMHQAEPLSNQDSTFPFALRYFSPDWGLRGVILAGFLAAIMAAISALANSTATIFALDVYHKLISKQADDRRLILVGKVASFSALAIAATVAPLVREMGGVFQYFQRGVTFAATPFIAVILLGILWKRTSYHGALFGLVGGLVIQLAVVGADAAWEWNLHWLYLGFIAQVLTMLGIVVVSYRTAPPRPDQWQPFLWSRSLLASYEDGVKRPWYQSVMLWYSIYAAAWVFVYWRFW